MSEPRPYQRVYADLRARIERGDLPAGTQLAGQPALATEYGVTLLTVRHAIELLRRGGYLTVEHGRGTFVAELSGAGTVLIVDDDPRVRSILVEHVTFGGHRVLQAGNGEEALDVLAREAVDLVFTDLRMPRMDGIEFLRRARPRCPGVVFVAISGYPEELVELYESDAFPITVIPKPFRAEQVRRALGLIQRREAGRPQAPGLGRAESGAVADSRALLETSNVLIVDDDAFHRAQLAELLRSRGVDVLEAADGSTALEIVDEERFSHIFLDFDLPGLGGAGLAPLIRERDDQAVIVFMSPRPGDAVRPRPDEPGGSGGPIVVLTKPVDADDVLPVLRLSLAPGETLEPPAR